VLDIQLMRIRAERAGWSEWVRPRHATTEREDAFVDAVARDPEGHRIAIEVERTLKPDYQPYILRRVLKRQAES
jgi:hypothetical protein